MKKCYLFILILSSVISANGQTQSIEVNAGWNLLSLPLVTPDSFKSVLFPSAVSSAFIFQNVYEVKNTLQNGPGFWLKFDSAETIRINGTAIYDDTIEVRAGWNLVGSLTLPFYADSMRTEPEGIIVSEFFNYPSGLGYQKADVILPGFGCWVKVDQDGLVILSSMGRPCPGEPTVDYAGRTYHTVQIGSQCWLRENLDVGTMIAGADTQKNNGIVEKYCYNDSIENCNAYGGLYQWNETMQYTTTEGTQGICPSGFHIPTPPELQTLSTAVGGNGNSLKREDQGRGIGQGTNTTGFSALLSGRHYNGFFNYLGIITDFWSSTESYSDVACAMRLYPDDGLIGVYYLTGKDNGFSIRCVKDLGEAPQVPEQSSPPNGAESIPAPPALIWKTTQGATSYTLQVSPDSLFSSFVYNQNELSDTSREIDGLTNSTKYYWRVSATNSHSTSNWSSKWTFTTSTQCPGTPTVDYAGKTYNTVQIGGQCWLKENLDVGSRIDGSQEQTNNSTIEKYCYNDDPNNCATYGGLYQWNEAMQYSTTPGARGICPSGWHIPTYAAFQTLSATVGGNGNALKNIGQGQGTGAGTNTSGFSALLAGFRINVGAFGDLGYVTYFWSSTEYNADYAFAMYLYYSDSDLNYYNYIYKENGFSVRCLKD